MWEKIRFLERISDHVVRDIADRTLRYRITWKYRFYESLDYKKYSLKVFELNIEKVDMQKIITKNQ